MTDRDITEPHGNEIWCLMCNYQFYPTITGAKYVLIEISKDVITIISTKI